MLLFYMTPLWSALLGRIVLKQRITAVRAFTMVLALTGMLTMFGLGNTVPLPRNAGDWMGLGAGLFWAVTAVRLRQDQVNSALDLTVWSFQWCALLGVTAAALLANTAMPDLHALARPLPGWCRWRSSSSSPARSPRRGDRSISTRRWSEFCS